MPNSLPDAPDLIRIGRKRLPTFKPGRASLNYFNRGVNAFANSPGITWKQRPGVNNYYTAGVNVAYGNMNAAQNQLGDLFNDIMGGIVPGWDQRSPELKNIKLKVDPAKVMQQAQRIMSPDQARKAAEIANQYGVSGTYRGMTMTPDRIAAAYQAGGISAAISEIPMLWWAAGAGGLGILYYFAKR